MKVYFNVFSDLINSFYRYMGRDKKPKPETKELWFNKIAGYQEHEIHEAFEKMKDNLDSVPFNIPKAIKQAIFEVNRSKAAQSNIWQDYGTCDGCNGSGGFRLLVYTQRGTPHTPIQYCSDCDNWRNYCNDPGDRISANELKGVGYQFRPLNRVLIVSPVNAVGVGSVDELEQLATQSIKSMED